jgi:glucose dehydrogenase
MNGLDEPRATERPGEAGHAEGRRLVLRVTAGMLAATAATAVLFIVGSAGAGAQAPGPADTAGDWPTYGANLASHRYSAADEITKDNFNKLPAHPSCST